MSKTKQLDLNGNFIEDYDIDLNRLETPDKVFLKIEQNGMALGIPLADLDICASENNRKCYWFISQEDDCLKTEFQIPARITESVYCNAPHKDYERILRRIFRQYEKYQLSAKILIPSNNEGTNYWNELVEPNRIEVNPNGFCFYYPYPDKIYFEIDGKPLLDKKGKPMFSRNRYKVLLLVKKSLLPEFKLKLMNLSRS